jgi:hypothetical protein
MNSEAIFEKSDEGKVVKKAKVKPLDLSKLQVDVISKKSL